MWKLVLLLSLLPVVVAVLGRKWLCDRVQRECAGRGTKHSGREIAEALLKASGKAKLVTLSEKKRTSISLEPPQLVLSNGLAEATDVVSLGRVAALTGQALVAAEQPDLLKWRLWVRRFGWAFPVFTAVVVIFAVVVAKLGATWGIAIVVAALGLASALSLASVMIEVEAAKLAEGLLDRSRVLPRSDDEEDVARCCRAEAYRHLPPGALEKLL